MPKINNPNIFMPGHAILIPDEKYSWLIDNLKQLGFKGMKNNIDAYEFFRKDHGKIVLYLEENKSISWSEPINYYTYYKDKYKLIDLR